MHVCFFALRYELFGNSSINIQCKTSHKSRQDWFKFFKLTENFTTLSLPTNTMLRQLATELNSSIRCFFFDVPHILMFQRIIIYWQGSPSSLAHTCDYQNKNLPQSQDYKYRRSAKCLIKYFTGQNVGIRTDLQFLDVHL